MNQEQREKVKDAFQKAHAILKDAAESLELGGEHGMDFILLVSDDRTGFTGNHSSAQALAAMLASAVKPEILQAALPLAALKKHEV